MAFPHFIPKSTFGAFPYPALFAADFWFCAKEKTGRVP
jgi:hypothetical protein